MNPLSFLRKQLLDPDIEASFAGLQIKTHEAGYDDWGFHPKAAKLYFSLAKRVSQYFRPEIHGLEHIPPGRVLLVPNHSGQLPFDGLVVSVAVLLGANPPRLVRSMAERWFPTLPFVNIAFSRSGVVVGDPVNCRNLLEADNAILVFPEGARGSGKSFFNRYQLMPFGRGFMRLALQTQTPIVPVGIVGAEESVISLGDFKSLAKALGMPYFPIPALLPFLGPAAYLPLPTKFHIYFGEPIIFQGPFDDEDAIIQTKVDVVRDTIDELIRQGLRERDGWY
jgi:1-acyl-sn-glycerol-3-phosphate acyltransferase